MDQFSEWGSLCCRPPADVAGRMRLEEALYAAGCSGIWQQDQGEIAAPGQKFTVDALVAYFPEPVEAELKKLADRLYSDGLVSAEVTYAPIIDEDWLAVWRQHFTLTELTAKTMVLPSWQEMPQADDKLYLKIYPGQGFGTGTHETTRLAAIMLEERMSASSRPTVLDVGTGSGILAILAGLRGAEKVLALDVDEDALENARENVTLNGLDNLIELSSRPLAAVAGRFDIVVANIIAPVLLEILPELAGSLKKNGFLILSGMLADQTAKVADQAASLGLEFLVDQSLNEWRSSLWRPANEKMSTV